MLFSSLSQELLRRAQQQLPELNTLLLLWQRLVKGSDKGHRQPEEEEQLIEAELGLSPDLGASDLPLP